MISQPYHLYVERWDASKNTLHYYALSIEANLFGDVCLLRRWGRIGRKGQMMAHHFRHEEEAVKLFLDLLRQKRKRGYRPRASAPT
ncbi:WGR domain-containing protein [Ensifer aridi]|uniref:WGR domain-containing protein n=1 Tax=Ensifer aridi TaxID=1708715 RepID=UPI000A1155D7|nr:WGR domain-containing protein [Ensifer aridi]